MQGMTLTRSLTWHGSAIKSGPATTANIRVLCKAHNRWLAERDYGSAFIEERIARARRERSTRQQAPERAREGAE